VNKIRFRVAPDMPYLIMSFNMSLFEDTHLSSASCGRPVLTGLRNRTGWFRVADAITSAVVITVFPTFVLAPKTWWIRRFLNSDDM